MAPSRTSRHPVTTRRLPAVRPANRAAPEQQALLFQFVALSLLLHVLMVLVFGSRIAGSERRGDGASGSLDVTLRRLSPESGSGFTLAPGADTRLPGSALLRLLRGASPAPVPAPVPPGDARPAAVTAPPEARTAGTPERATRPEAAPPAPEAAPSAAPPAFEALPQLDRSAPEEVDKPLTPPAAAPPIERERAPAIAPPVREVPVAAPVLQEPVPPPKREPLAAPPPEVAPREVPLPAPIEQVAPREVPLPAPIERMAPATVKPEPAPPAELTPVPPTVPSERVTLPAIEREPTPPVDVPVPRKAPLEATPLPERVAPKTERAVLPAAETAPKSDAVDAAPRAQPAAPPAPAAQRPPTPIERMAPARPGVSPAESAPRPRLGIPDADEEAFKPRGDALAPPSEPGGAPRIDLEATRRRAREITSETSGSPGLLPVVPPPPTAARKPNLADAIAKAAKPDCRTAYADLGLLAVAPLVASTVGNGGCRW